MCPWKVDRLPVSIDDFRKKIQTFFQFSWVVVYNYTLYAIVSNCCSFKVFKQLEPNLSEMDVLILIKEFFHI